MRSAGKYKALSFILGFGVVLFLFAPQVSAKVTAFVTQDKTGVLYEYPYEELLRSYVKYCLGAASPLFDDYAQKDMALFLDDVNDYVDYQEALKEYAKAVFNNKPFDLDVYASSPDAQLVEIAKVRVVTYEDGKLVYTDKEIASPAEVALFDINTAKDALTIRRVIEGKARFLGLDLGLYNTLFDVGKDTVATYVLQARGDGFRDTDSLKAVFDGEVYRVQETVAGILESLNAATDPGEFADLLLDSGEEFELELDAFAMIISSRQGQVLATVFNGLPFESPLALKSIFNDAVSTVLRSYVLVTNTAYDYSLSHMLDIQMTRRPQIQKGGKWVNANRDEVASFVNPTAFLLPDLIDHVAELVVSTGVLIVRDAPTTEGNSIATVKKGEIYPVEEYREILGGTADGSDGYWFKITVGEDTGWICGRYADWVAESHDPKMFQFLILSGKSGVTVTDLGYILKGKGILDGTEMVFFQASRSNNINEIFLTSLSLHETGNGTSQLANGVEFNGKRVYNMFGIGAIDSNPIYKGAEYAYNHGWFTPEEAIIGGAYFVAGNYVNNSNYYQDTLYKMRWNPGAPGKHQYATDIGWASKQTSFIRQFYNQINIYSLRFDIPLYKRDTSE